MTYSHDDDRYAYDADQRRTAGQLNQHYPQWYVMWGAHSRRYWAFPLFSAQPGTLVSAETPAELTARMQHVQTTSTFPPQPPGY